MTAKHPWLTKRKNTFYLRAKVPSDIRAFYPKAEVKRSLKTQDKLVAARLIHAEAAIVEREFGEYRKHRGPPPRPSSIQRYAKGFECRYAGVGPPPADLTSSEELADDEIRRFVVRYWAERRSWVDEPISCFGAQERREYAAQLDIEAAQSPADDDRLFTRMVQLATTVLETNGFFFDRKGFKATKLGEMLLRAESEVLRQRAALLRGEPTSVPFDNLFAVVSRDEAKQSYSANSESGARCSLNQLIARYENDPSRLKISNKTRAEDARTFSHLREVFKGHRPIAELGKKECRAFRDLICSIPKDAQIVCRGMTAKQAAVEAASRNLQRLSNKGANKYLHKLSALMRYAIDQDEHDGPNPAHKIALPHEHSIDDRDPFSSSQLRAIFSSSQFEVSASYRAEVGKGASFWVPALALFMGLRQGEACQLMAHDFDNEKGVDYLQIQDDFGRRLKTSNAKRKIPCHPHLIRLGLLEFVERARRDSTTGRLFPEEKHGKDGHFSPFSKRFTRFLQSIGARRPKTSFHSFRHNFRDALRDAETPNEMALALGGWKAAWSSTGDSYGSRRQIPRLAVEISKIDYAEFPLDVLLAVS